MYFIKPTRSIPFVEQALEALPDLQVIHIDDLYMIQQLSQLQMYKIS